MSRAFAIFPKLADMACIASAACAISGVGWTVATFGKAFALEMLGSEDADGSIFWLEDDVGSEASGFGSCSGVGSWLLPAVADNWPAWLPVFFLVLLAMTIDEETIHERAQPDKM